MPGYAFVISGLDFRHLPPAAGLCARDQQHLRLRGTFYFVGAVVLMVMWAIYIVEVLTGVICVTALRRYRADDASRRCGRCNDAGTSRVTASREIA